MTVRYGVVLVVAAALLGGTGTAAAATPNQRLAKLERIVRTQAAQIAMLDQRLLQANAKIITLEANARKSDTLNQCLHAIGSDGYHLAWRGVNILANELGLPAVFGPWTPINDLGACAASGITRAPVYHR